MTLRLLAGTVGLLFVLLLIPLVSGQDGGPAAKPVDLPLTRIVLFNAGVGYFQREGVVDGNARVEMRFPEPDVNDLLKSLVLEDKDGGKVKAITYDGKHPVEVTLKAFTIDVTANPTIGDLLAQVRGEKVEITDKQGGSVTGLIVGIDRPQAVTTTFTQKDGEPSTTTTTTPTAAGETLNLLTADGLQAVPLAQAKKIKLLKAELEAEFRKALEVLAAARGASKKAITVNFDGNGRRRVRVGYVMEAPMWKASYRLSLGDKPTAGLQGWAAVENTTEEDWTNVKVGLVAGRPMAFQMDLYQPLFVPRPTVEPELYASLRPPVYQGGVAAAGQFGGGGFGGGGLGGMPGAGAANNLGAGGGLAGIGGLGGNLGFQGQYGIQGGQFGRPSARELMGPRLSYEELQGRLSQKVEGMAGVPAKPSGPNGGSHSTVLSAAAAVALGDTFEYKIEDPITLPRLKSALLPIVNDPVETKRVSIYNANVQNKHPLLGVRLTNKSKLHLAQGPVTVYDGETFVGDARLPDLAAGESRLISYAIDLHTEVVPRDGEAKRTVEMVAFRGGRLVTREITRQTTEYVIRNRGSQDRQLIIERPIRSGWKPAATTKPSETTRDSYRFEVTAKAGATTTLTVGEESLTPEDLVVERMADTALQFYAATAAASPAIKQAAGQILELRGVQEATKKASADEDAALKAIGEDQTRIRANLERVPKDSDAYKRYLKKFDDQETEIEKRQAKQKELKAKLAADEKAYKDYLTKLKVE
ncbi:DUF4139 domain-containing protein [Limnoglobus roseus]|uniref:DUF4139 domain-containing protein n=1 Tax=Limnoglobus roseus TaxID=2598579 RepID=A0A5C1ASD1_9BACT|nr:DUF4139 domain-containing protein [Limnoglobus roseus]QEL20946.1 hypothetical protein PX52LOC_08074 [Limnoglobus roseus]